MKIITIRLSDVEAAMLVELQKRNKAFRDLKSYLLQQIRLEYGKTPGRSPGVVSCYLFPAEAVVSTAGMVALWTSAAARIWNGVFGVGIPGFAKVATGVIALWAAATYFLYDLCVGWCANGC